MLAAFQDSEIPLCQRSPEAVATLETVLQKRLCLEHNIGSSSLQAALLFSLVGASLGGIPLMLLF